MWRALLDGFASLLNIWPNDEPQRPRGGIADDWRRVGDYLRDAMKGL